MIRQPGNIVVCDKTTDRTITDRLEVSRLTYYYYDVVTFVGETQGETTPSNKILVGEAFSIPYTENFSNADNFNLFTVIDANHDGKYWTWDEERAKSGYSVTNDMDDWLITPPMKFDSGYIYTMRFNVSTRSYVEKFNVWFGTEPTVEGMTKEILPTISTDNKEPRRLPSSSARRRQAPAISASIRSATASATTSSSTTSKLSAPPLSRLPPQSQTSPSRPPTRAP